MSRSGHGEHSVVSLPSMTVLPVRSDPPARAKRGRHNARLLARGGTALAACAPLVLVVMCALPGHRPHDLLSTLLSLIAAAVLVLAAAVASSERSRRAGPAASEATALPVRHGEVGETACTQGPGQVPGPGPAVADAPRMPDPWSDPAVTSVERWSARWPGIAGVSAVSWWAARLGAAGLLATVGLQAAGVTGAPWAAAATVAVLAVVSVAPAGRHLARGALGVVALAGLAVTAAGAFAVLRGQLTAPILPAGPFLPVRNSGGTVADEAATTVVLICLAATCLPAFTAARGGARARLGKAVTGAVMSTSVLCWALVVPLLLRAAGFSPLGITLYGGPGALARALSAVLAPASGAGAPGAAHAVLLVACLAGALGAVAGGTGLAECALGAYLSTRAGRHGPAAAGSATPAPPWLAKKLPWRGVAAIGASSAAGAAAVAYAGPRDWLVVALGGLATSALALCTLAPPVMRRCQHVPSVVRAVVATLWALVVTAAIGSAGPSALALDGIACLSGAFALGWRGQNIKGRWRPRHTAIPWGTAATALVTTSAVTALEVVAVGRPSASGIWHGLGVLVMAAGIVVLAVVPATSRLRVEHLAYTMSALTQKTLPALIGTLEAVASGEPGRTPPTAALSDLKAATRPLETELGAYRGSDEVLALTQALVEASHQIQRLGQAVEAVARLDGQRLEELVEERTAALSSVNRHLVDSQWRRRQLLDRTVRVAEGERARIAANLHDGPVQRLASLGLILDRCRLRLDRDDQAGARELVKRARTSLSDEIHSLRRMMSELRPPILDEGGLEAALRDHLSAWSQATGVEGRFEAGPRPPLSPNSETVMYRVVQEALANVAKHARASLTTVTISGVGAGVQVVVRDNGKGFSTPSQPDLLRSGHFGLVVMRERVELAAGKFEVQSAPRTGTEVVIWVPGSSSREPLEAA
ncbi:MAG TPA: sensor histidine kinase [Acidimicrobiales bacterium]|nr:sensor histidine kinase [Acidimicrobiales bacterium]